jgi:two-component system chemotaxis sensor kinase CheA
VAPLFNRFKRVVRDLSTARGKKVNLRIRGEKTELDKRMIDELGDPLVHLVRNSIDHGLESPDVRLARGKPEAGTILLEASHSGNSVFIHVRDDGGGIDVARIKDRLVAREILTAVEVERLSDAEAVDYIWHPGFSTAQEVTNVSGRGVGMDAVKARIADLNGTIDVDSAPQEGTTFTIRLPLTLAIINSLLIRIRDVIFSMPIEDVREIVCPRDRRRVPCRHRDGSRPPDYRRARRVPAADQHR